MTQVGSRHFFQSPKAMVNLEDRILCATFDTCVYAYTMDASLAHLWTVEFSGLDYGLHQARGEHAECHTGTPGEARHQCLGSRLVDW